jgi:2-iminobutanoate/2-iminopropanoate deaminase
MATKEVFFVQDAQRHTSPIPEGVKAGPFIYLSAIRGIDPATQRVESDDPEVQSRQIFKVVERTLAAAGATLQDVVKVAVFMKNLDDRTAFNKVWAEVWPTDPPARFAVQVYDMGGPGDKSKILVDVTALAPQQ